MRTPPVLRGFRAAWIFLTRIPVGGEDYRDDDWRWSTAWFPGVGACLGVILAALWLLTDGLGPWSAAFLVIGASLLLTGGFHEDGLADSADALGAGGDRDKAFLIMRDSRLGSYGGLALICSVGLRWTALASLPLGAAPAALIAAPVASRWLVVHLMRIPPARPDGLGRGAGTPDTRATLIALAEG